VNSNGLPWHAACSNIICRSARATTGEPLNFAFTRLLWVGLLLPPLLFTSCKSQVHGSGYGGSDSLWTTLNASRAVVREKIQVWESAPSDTLWCEPARCEESAQACQILRGLQTDPSLLAAVRESLQDKGLASRYRTRLALAEFTIQETVIKEGVGAVDASTPLTLQGPFSIQFSRERMTPKFPVETEFTWLHELGHASLGLNDEDSHRGASVQTLLDAIAACVVIGPGTIAPPAATPAPVAPIPGFIVEETYENQTAARVNDYYWNEATFERSLPPTKLFPLHALPAGEGKIYLTHVSGNSIAGIPIDGGSEARFVSACPQGWALYFRRADGSLIISNYQDLPLSAAANGLAIPREATSAWIGYTDTCRASGCDSDYYADNEGMRWTTSELSTGGCRFSFRLMRNVPAP